RDREVRGAAQIEARADVVADEARWLLVVARRETRRVPEYERRRILRRGRQQLERAARTLDRRAEDERVPLERGNVDAERVVDPRAKVVVGGVRRAGASEVDLRLVHPV